LSSAVFTFIVYRQYCWPRPSAVLSAANEYGVCAKRIPRAPAGRTMLKHVTFYSEGVKLAGDLFLPADIKTFKGDHGGGGT